MASNGTAFYHSDDIKHFKLFMDAVPNKIQF